jgi:hypothetical protein
MKLLTKFNLVLVLVFGVVVLLISHYAYVFLMKNAQQQVLQQAEFMAASASATKDYTVNEVSPILEKTPLHTSDFLPGVPNWSGERIFMASRPCEIRCRTSYTTPRPPAPSFATIS